MIERRAFARHKTFIKGRIYFNNRLSSVDCILRDVADIGGRLEDNATIPDAFELYIPTKQEHFQARVKWRKGNILGIAWGAEQSPKPGFDLAAADESFAERLGKIERDIAILKRRLDALQGE